MDLIISDFQNFVNIYPDKEVELVFTKFNIHQTKIFENIKANAFLEIIKMEKDHKLRYRHSIRNLTGYDHNIKNILNNLNMNWIKKKEIDKKIYKPFEISIKAAEEKEHFIHINIFDASFKIFFVVQHLIEIDNFILDLKFKYYIGNGNNFNYNLRNSLNNIKNFDKTPVCYLEIEYKPSDIKDIKLELSNILDKIYGLNSPGYIYEKIGKKTIELPFDKNEVWKNKILTHKFDGEYFYYTFYNNTLILYSFNYPALSFNLKSFKSSVELKGQGEVIKNFKDNKTYFCPFNIYLDKKQVDITLLKKYIEKVEDIEEDEIYIYFKDFFKVESQEEFDKLFEMKEYEGFKLDGLISLGEEFDYKIKPQVTYDYLFHAVVNLGGITNDEQIMFKNIVFENGSFKEGNIILKLKTSDEFLTADMNFPIIYYFHDNNRYILPKFCQLEINDKKEVVKLRLDKSTQTINNRWYTGNQINNFIENKIVYNKLNPDITKNGYFAKNESPERSMLNIITNFCKTCVISLTENHVHRNGKQTCILDIDSGRGGDIFKHFFAHIKKLVATDIDPEAKAEAMLRYNSTIGKKQVLGGKNKALGFNYYYDIISILDESFSEIVKKDHLRVFDVINWHMAIHYSFGDKNIPRILSNIDKVSEYLTVLNITCFDGKKLKELFFNSDELKFKISEDDELIIKKKDNDIVSVTTKYFGTKNEYLVIPNELITSLKSIQFVLIEKLSFLDIVYQSKVFLKDLEFFEKNSSALNFLKEYQTVILNNKCDLQLLNILTVYVFQKMPF